MSGFLRTRTIVRSTSPFPLPSAQVDMGILDIALGGPLIGSFVNSMLFMLEIVQGRHDAHVGSRLA
jgi:hypothetical protein